MKLKRFTWSASVKKGKLRRKKRKSKKLPMSIMCTSCFKIRVVKY